MAFIIDDDEYDFDLDDAVGRDDGVQPRASREVVRTAAPTATTAAFSARGRVVTLDALLRGTGVVAATSAVRTAPATTPATAPAPARAPVPPPLAPPTVLRASSQRTMSPPLEVADESPAETNSGDAAYVEDFEADGVVASGRSPRSDTGAVGVAVRARQSVPQPPVHAVVAPASGSGWDLLRSEGAPARGADAGGAAPAVVATHTAPLALAAPLPALFPPVGGAPQSIAGARRAPHTPLLAELGQLLADARIADGGDGGQPVAVRWPGSRVHARVPACCASDTAVADALRRYAAVLATARAAHARAAQELKSRVDDAWRAAAAAEADAGGARAPMADGRRAAELTT